MINLKYPIFLLSIGCFIIINASNLFSRPTDTAEKIAVRESGVQTEDNFSGPAIISPQLIKPLGIVAYSCILITFLSGLLRKKFKYNKWLKFHKSFAVFSFLCATAHALLILSLS